MLIHCLSPQIALSYTGLGEAYSFIARRHPGGCMYSIPSLYIHVTAFKEAEEFMRTLGTGGGSICPQEDVPRNFWALGNDHILVIGTTDF